MQLVFDAKGDQVKAVYMAVDQATFSADPEETKFPLTDYLYDDNVFNDIPYLLNKDVLLDYILRPLADRKDASDWSELYLSLIHIFCSNCKCSQERRSTGIRRCNRTEYCDH